MAELKRLRPATEGNIEIARVVSWGGDRYARGAYAYFAPGQISSASFGIRWLNPGSAFTLPENIRRAPLRAWNQH